MAKVLIIDDSATIVAVIKDILETNGYSVITASDGHSGLDMAKKEMPDLIILDLMLPKMDGYQVCRLLKFDCTYSRIPIIMFSAKSSDEAKKTGKEVGADDYITKDFDPSHLLELVNKYTAKKP